MATYFVCPSTGNDTNSGTSFGSGNAWKSTQKAADATGAGDLVNLCAEATETVTAAIDMDTGNGGQTSETVFRGMDGTAGTTPAKYTIQAVSSMSALLNYNTNGVGRFRKWRDVSFDANGNATNVLTAVSTIDFQEFLRCEFLNATGDGLDLRDARWHFLECLIANNGDDGIFCNNPLTYMRIMGCIIRDNAGRGVRLEFNTSRYCTISRSEFYRNGAAGISLRADLAHGTLVEYCTVYDNGGDGVETDGTSYGMMIANNAFVENAGYGEDHNGASRVNISSHNNLYYLNSVGASRNALIGDANSHLTSDPQFVDAANGDFTPGPSSPLIGAGSLGSTIGAREPAPGGGGGGTSSILGWLGMRGGMQ